MGADMDAGCEEGEVVGTGAAVTDTLCALDTGSSWLHRSLASTFHHCSRQTHLRSGKAPTFPASPKPENDLDLGRAAPTCGTKFGREIGAMGALLLVVDSCTPASIAADRRGSLSGEVLVRSALGFGLVSFALLGGGAPRRGPAAAGATELLRIGAETVAARAGGTGAIDVGVVTPG